MKRRFLIVCIFVSFVSTNLYSQIEAEIKSFVDSTELIVNNGRRMLLEKISNRDFPKAQEIYNYLTKLTLSKNYSAFHYSEDIYINILFCDWYNLSLLMLDYKKNFRKTLSPNSYQISKILYERISDQGDSLLYECHKSHLDNESEKLIELIIHLIKTGSVDSEYYAKLNAFKKEFKPSKYEDIINNYIPKSKINSSISWSLGSGMVIPTGNLAKNFSSRVAINFAMDINIQRVFTSLYINGSNMKLRVPFEVSSGTETLLFRMDETFHYMDAGLKGGYFLTRNDKFNFAPYASISGSLLESKRYESEAEGKEYKVFNSFTYGAGLHTELKIANFKTNNIYGYNTPGFVSMKMEGGYNFITKFEDNYFKGNSAYFSIAFVWGIGDF